ncbi:MAG: hypothetical protein IJB67_02305 [Firmicutes bacterium]|nr:hypothetical protein [Bacillota bacterium]
MDTRIVLRLVSLIMLIAAVVFVVCALSAPNLGQTIYIDGWEFGAEQWRVCYAIYAVVMIALFVVSFLVRQTDK